MHPQLICQALLVITSGTIMICNTLVFSRNPESSCHNNAGCLVPLLLTGSAMIITGVCFIIGDMISARKRLALESRDDKGTASSFFTKQRHIKNPEADEYTLLTDVNFKAADRHLIAV